MKLISIGDTKTSVASVFSKQYPKVKLTKNIVNLNKAGVVLTFSDNILISINKM